MEEKYSDVYLEQLAHKYKTAGLTAEEQSEFDNWYNSHNDAEFEHSAAAAPLMVKARMFKKLMEGMQVDQPVAVIKYPFKWHRVAIAASLFLIAGFSVYFFSIKDKVKTSTHVTQVKPGRNAATLTLANGKKILLSDALKGELANEAGLSIVKTAEGQLVYEVKAGESYKINTLSTTNGETYMVTLPDQSRVWLNAASSLTYATAVNEQGKRWVELNGEAYFEIAKDKQHPFIVKSKGQEVEVFGTHFNVNSYPEEGLSKTTLIEGTVRVTANFKSKTSRQFLKPGEQAVVGDGIIHIAAVDTDEEIAWKNGEFNFNGQDFKTMMRMISRWYDVDINYEYDPKDLHISGKLSRYRNLTEVLNMLEVTGEIKFKVEGRRITVLK